MCFEGVVNGGCRDPDRGELPTLCTEPFNRAFGAGSSAEWFQVSGVAVSYGAPSGAGGAFPGGVVFKLRELVTIRGVDWSVGGGGDGEEAEGGMPVEE